MRNLFSTPLTKEEQAASQRYTDLVELKVQEAIKDAFENRQPAILEIGSQDVAFAVNRRVLQNGKWSGFGHQPDGATDLRMRLLAVKSMQGEVLGGAFLYACHCTTLGTVNQISGDWSGIASQQLEAQYKESTFLSIIGCGADQNPGPRGEYDMAVNYGTRIATAVGDLIQSEELRKLDEFPRAHFGYAGLIPEQPTTQQLEEMAASGRSNDRAWADHMVRVKKKRAGYQSLIRCQFIPLSLATN